MEFSYSIQIPFVFNLQTSHEETPRRQGRGGTALVIALALHKFHCCKGTRKMESNIYTTYYVK